MTDDRRMTVYRVGEEAAQRVIPRRPVGEEAGHQRDSRRPAGKPAGRAPGKRRGVAAGRIAAAGVGVAAVLGLTANMQLAGSHAEAAQAATPAPTGPAPSMAALRWEKSAFQGPATKPDRLVASTGRKPIVLTPHTIVNTVGGGSSGGSSGGSYAGSYAAPVAAAAPVATTSGSAPH